MMQRQRQLLMVLSNVSFLLIITTTSDLAPRRLKAPDQNQLHKTIFDLFYSKELSGDAGPVRCQSDWGSDLT